MPRIPEETLQQVLAATDIVDLIGRSVKLRRAGSNWVGLCPFHNEKSPSFNVRPSTHSYHCFGCQAGGNAFRFLMEHDGLTFMEAVKRLADAANIRIEEEVWDANAEREARRRSLMIRAHKELAEWYHQLLLRHEMADPARQYLKKRGINSAMAKNWQIGYAPASGPMLRQWAAKFKFDRQLLIDAGILVYKEETDEVYPNFRHRLMFPIRNGNGDVIAFSGRLLDPEAKTRKYVNSPETPIFSKSKVLFGFDKSRRFIAKSSQAIVCEGQIDTLMLFEAGFQNVVAGQGTAFTEVHARSLKQLADEVVLCYDSDNAGREAVRKAFRILSPTGLIVKVAALPAGEDPDSMIRNQGADAFRELLKGAKDFTDYQLEVSGSLDLEDMRARVKFAQDMVDYIRLLDSPIARQTSAQRVAMRLGIPEDMVLKMLTKAINAAQRPTKTSAAAKIAGATEENSGPTAQQLLDSQDRNSLLICRMALADAQVLAWLRECGQEDLLRDLPGAELLGLVWRGSFDPLDPAAFNVFLSTLDRAEEAALTSLMHQAAPGGGVEEARHALMAMEITRLQNQKQRLQTQLKHPGLSEEDAAEIQRDIMDLHRELQAAQAELQRHTRPSTGERR